MACRLIRLQMNYPAASGRGILIRINPRGTRCNSNALGILRVPRRRFRIPAMTSARVKNGGKLWSKMTSSTYRFRTHETVTTELSTILTIASFSIAGLCSPSSLNSKIQMRFNLWTAGVPALANFFTVV